MVRLAQEYSAGLIQAGVQRMRFDEPHQLLVKRLFVTGGLPIQDDEIGLESPQPPVCMRNQQIAHKAEPLRLHD
jgi:hypothetical protein